MEGDTALSTVRAAYAAFGRADAQAALEIFADDAVYVIGGSSEISGEHRGKQAILALWAQIAQAGGELTVDGFFSDGERVVVLVQERVGDIAWRAASVLTFREGRAVRFESIEDSAALERAFGRRES